MFTLAQRAEFFPLRDHAWRSFAAANGRDAKDKIAKDGWYRELMVKELGVYSSNELSPLNDYTKAMAIMEAIAGGSYVWTPAKPKPVRTFELGRMHWNMQATKSEEARRYLYLIRQVCKEHDLDDDYVCATARKVGNLDSRPLIDSLTALVLWKTLVALRIFVARKEAA